MCQNSVKIKLHALYIQSIYTLQKSKIHTIYLKIVIAKKKKNSVFRPFTSKKINLY